MKLVALLEAIPCSGAVPGSHYRMQFILGQSLGPVSALHTRWPAFLAPCQHSVIKIIIPHRFPQPAWQLYVIPDRGFPLTNWHNVYFRL
jgi:hypothetical protein